MQDVLAFVSLGLTLLGVQAGAIVWVINHVAGAVREMREHVKELYARREDMRALEAHLTGLDKKLDEIRDAVLRSKP